MNYQPASNNLQIPGSNTFLFNFALNLSPPTLPLPQPKTLHYPLAAERFLAPSITYYDMVHSNQMLPCLETNFLKYIHRPQEFRSQQEKTLTQEDKELLEDVRWAQVEREVKKEEKIEDILINDEKDKEVRVDFEQLNGGGFGLKVEVHPQTGKKLKRSWDLLPAQDKEVASVIGKEVDLLNAESLIKIDHDLDQQEIIKWFEKKEDTYIHQGNYTFTKNIGNQEELLFQFGEHQAKATVQKLKGNFILHRKRQTINQRTLVDKSLKRKTENIQLTVANVSQEVVQKRVKLSEDNSEDNSEQKSEQKSDIQEKKGDNQRWVSELNGDESSEELKY